jgi:hypothetical protein
LANVASHSSPQPEQVTLEVESDFFEPKLANWQGPIKSFISVVYGESSLSAEFHAPHAHP